MMIKSRGVSGEKVTPNARRTRLEQEQPIYVARLDNEDDRKPVARPDAEDQKPAAILDKEYRIFDAFLGVYFPLESKPISARGSRSRRRCR
jgi:hypothetical protein